MLGQNIRTLEISGAVGTDHVAITGSIYETDGETWYISVETSTYINRSADHTKTVRETMLSRHDSAEYHLGRLVAAHVTSASFDTIERTMDETL